MQFYLGKNYRINMNLSQDERILGRLDNISKKLGGNYICWYRHKNQEHVEDHFIITNPPLSSWVETILDEYKHTLWNEMQMRFIPSKLCMNHLRWGLTRGGGYYLIQAHTNILNQVALNNKNQVWNKIQNLQAWPKILAFHFLLWLLY